MSPKPEPAEWLSFPVYIDGKRAYDGISLEGDDADVARRVYDRIGHVVNPIEQPRGDGKCIPMDLFDAFCEYDEIAENSGALPLDKILGLVERVANHYGLYRGSCGNDFVRPIDEKNPKIFLVTSRLTSAYNDLRRWLHMIPQ